MGSQMRLLSSVLLLSLFACKPENEVIPIEVIDDDGDGIPAEEDCNDEDGTVNPSAPDDDCDGVDDNCNDLVDEDAPTSVYFEDTDGDGHGEDGTEILACSPPEGYVESNDDCDDDNDQIYPGAEEICNDLDDDCDNEYDEGVTTTFYRDADKDEFGDARNSVEACEQPAGYVSDDTDCDDRLADVYPGADEYCNDRDDDCDREIDETPVDAVLGWFDADGDGFGDPATEDYYCDPTTNNLDCDDTDSTEPKVVDPTTGAASGSGDFSDPVDTIQLGIDLASLCVAVYSGTYSEIITFDGKNLDVFSIDGSKTTIIDGTDLGDTVVAFENGETPDAKLRGFTITNGTGRYETSSTSYACGSESTCTDTYDTYAGGGVYVSGADPTLSDLVITGNSLPDASTTTSGNNTYYTASFGGGIALLASNATLTDVWLKNNDADQGGGMYLDEYSVIEATRTVAALNTATDGGGANVDGGSLTLTNTITLFNEASDSGGGVFVSGDLAATNVSITGDDAVSGGGVYVYGSGYASLGNAIVYGAAAGYGVLSESGGTVAVEYTDAFNNTPDDYSGITDPTGTLGNVSVNPVFTAWTDDGNATNDDLTLKATSKLIDAGDPSITDDDGSTSDIGAYGGPGAAGW